jgi:putative hemolysin
MIELLLVLALIAAGGVLAGAEMAVVTARRGRLEQAAEAGSARARAALRLRRDPDRFLATVQVGITLVGAIAAAYSGQTLATRLEPWLRGLGCGDTAPNIAFGLVVALVTYLSVVFGELVPKSLALQVADRYALAIARPMVLLGWIARPIVWVLSTSSNLVLRLFGDRTNFVEGKLTREDLEHLVEEASTGGGIDEHTGALVARALEFSSLRVGDVMVPRRFVHAVAADAPAEALRTAMLDRGHRRVPVYRGSADHIVGYVLREDVLARLWSQQPVAVADLVREPFFVPETMSAERALRELQQRRLHLAIVVEERGGMAGLITLEDLVEELVGEIFHEHDAAPPRPILREAPGVWRVLGSVAPRELARELRIDLPEGDGERTLSGIIVTAAGDRVPAVGERFRLAPTVEIEVVEASPRRVRALRLRRVAADAPDAPAAPTAP